MPNDLPVPNMTPAAINPFLAALREGAPLTYLTMLDAGLGTQFDPLPVNAQGHGFLSSMLNCSTHEQGVELCARWAALGVDSTALQQRPDHAAQGPAWNGVSQCLSAEQVSAGVPLASLAISYGRPHFSSLWRDLTPESLLAISDSALPLAVQTDNSPALTALLAAGANPNMLDGEKTPVVFRALTPENLSLLLEAGADLRARAPEGVYLSGRRVPAEGVSVHESIMMSSSLDYRARELRVLALAWLKAHPPAQDPDSDLAQAAFEAIARKSKQSTRACLQSLGARAVGRLNTAGDSLAICCAVQGNFLDTARLIKLGTNPFEITPSGRSLWGEIKRSANKMDPNTWKTAERTQKIRATKILNDFENPRTRPTPIPWTLQSASGSTLLETLIGTTPLAEFLGWAETAFAAGLDPRAPLSDGMDLSSRLALHLVLETPWVGRSGFTEIKRTEAKIAMDFLAIHPISLCSQTVLAAWARRFTQTTRELVLDGMPCSSYQNGMRVLETNSLWFDALSGAFEAWGATAHEVPDFESPALNLTAASRARARSCFEIGHLRVLSEQTAPKPDSALTRRL